MRLVERRLSNREIGRALSIGSSTVAWYLHRLFEGLNLPDGRMELADWWRDHRATLESDPRSAITVRPHRTGCSCWWCEAA